MDITRVPVVWVRKLLQMLGISEHRLEGWDPIISFLVIIATAFVVAEVIYRLTYFVLKRLTRHKEYKFISLLFKYKVLRKSSYLIPPIFINAVLPVLLETTPLAMRYIENIVWIYFTVALVLSINAILNSLGESAYSNSKYHDRPIKGFIQITKVIIYIIATIVVISILTNKSPLYLIGGLGAFATA